MKNWNVFILATVVCFFSAAYLMAQNTTPKVYSDTLNVMVDVQSIGINSHFFIGLVNAIDPEGQELEYHIIHQHSSPYFTIDMHYGHIYTQRRYLQELCEMGSYDLKVNVTDGLYWTTSTILIIIQCI